MADEVKNLQARLIAISRLTSDYNAMLRAVLDAEAKNPDEHMVYVLKGWAYANLGDEDKAEEAFSKALALNPKSAWAHYRRGEMLSALGRGADALSAFENAVILKPNRPDFWLAKASAEDGLAMIPEAYASYMKATQLGDKTGRGWFGRARILAYMNRLDEALEAARNALGLDRDRVEYKALEDYLVEKLSGY